MQTNNIDTSILVLQPGDLVSKRSLECLEEKKKKSTLLFAIMTDFKMYPDIHQYELFYLSLG